MATITKEPGQRQATRVDTPAAAFPPPYRFSVADYERMGEVGILHEDSCVELIGGEIVTMSPLGVAHVQAINNLTRILVRTAPDDVTVSVQNPVNLSNNTQPQPDCAVLRGAGRGLVDASDVLIVIEVSDSSYKHNRTTKLPLYAAAGIPEAWIVDVHAGRIERHTEPGPDGYEAVSTLRRGAVVQSTSVPTLAVPVDVVCGPIEKTAAKDTQGKEGQ